MEQNFLFQVRKQYTTLRDSEKKVADVLLSQEFDVVSSTIEGLAAAAGVSQPTIIRFAHAFSLKGFRDIKRTLMAEAIAREQQTQLSQVVSFAVAPTDKLVDTPAKVITTHIKHLQDIYQRKRRF